MDILVVDSVGHIFAYQQEHAQSPLTIPDVEMSYMGEGVLGYVILSGKKRSRKFLRHLTNQTLAKTVLTKEGSATLTGTHVLLKTAANLYDVRIDRYGLTSVVITTPKAYGSQSELATILMTKSGWPGDMVVEFIYENFMARYHPPDKRPVITRMAYIDLCVDMIEVHQMGTHSGLAQGLNEAERVFTRNAIDSRSLPILLAYSATTSKETK